jgi:phage FluMu protein Com
MMLGALACQHCGTARADAPDKADWLVRVAGAALCEVRCPACPDDAGGAASFWDAEEAS